MLQCASAASGSINSRGTQHFSSKLQWRLWLFLATTVIGLLVLAMSCFAFKRTAMTIIFPLKGCKKAWVSYQKLIGVMRLSHVDNGIFFHCKCLPCLRVYQCAEQTLKKHWQACLNAYFIDCTNSHTARLSDVWVQPSNAWAYKLKLALHFFELTDERKQLLVIQSTLSL